ncbi:hypothetical protein [Chitinophaga alhagiae]|uniref:hypothetical protein n=1 Tax=Chitinophaga alhagiae TaxID=2203219 RepID=UPI000E5AFC60|nr:hypothetical protein [Chitinophaga alhagiae]
MKKLFATTLFVFMSLYASSQYQQIVPITPEAAALTKVVNYPVDLNTGVPNINIPFHEIKTGGLVLPIGINYHAGGFKINEQSTRAGLGWSLNCELQITRTVNGLDDFSPGGYYNNTLVKAYHTNNPGYNAYPFKDFTSDFISRGENGLATGQVDGQPDKFTYQLLNKTGSFYIQKNDAGNVAGIVAVPYDNIKIEYANGSFTITDTDGTVYYFGEPGVGPLSSRHLSGIEYTEVTYPNSPIRTAWKCKKIENASKTAQINFEYLLKPVALFRKATDYIEYYHTIDINFYPPFGSDCAQNLFRGDEYPASSISEYNNLLSNIPFQNLSSPKYMEHFGYGGQKFHLPYLSQDGTSLIDKVYSVNTGGFFPSLATISGVVLSKITFNGGSVEFTGTDQLNSLYVRDKFNNVVKDITFYQSLIAPIYLSTAKIFNGDDYNGTTYLDSIRINGSDIYRFSYKNKIAFGNHLIGQDAWGYRNSHTTEVDSYSSDYPRNVPRQSDLLEKHLTRFPYACTEIIPPFDFSVGGSSTAEVTDAEYMAFGTLQRIIHPTGGYTDFDLEPNRYNENINIFNDDQPNTTAVPRVGGGLRVRSISYYDGIEQIVPAWRKIYKYGELENGMGIALNKPAAIYNGIKRGYDAFVYEQYVGYAVRESINCGDPLSCFRLVATESKKTLAPASYLNYAYPNGAPIYYTKVAEYQHDLGVVTGKREYAYYRPGKFNLIEGIPPLELMHTTSIIEGTNIPWQHSSGLMGALKSESDYKFENCEMKLFRQKDYHYKPYIRPLQIRVACSFLKTIYQLNGTPPDISGGIYNDFVSFSGVTRPPEIYKSNEYGIAVGKLLLESEEEKWFNNNSTMTNSITYYYDSDQYIQPTRMRTVNSKGDLIETRLLYPYNLTSDPVYANMTQKNIINPVIEEKTTNLSNSRELHLTRNNYSNFTAGTGFIAPASIQKSYDGGTLRSEVVFDQYDQWGNLLQLTTKDQLVKSYVWAYDGQYPVSEVTGLAYSEVDAIVNPNPGSPISTSYDELDIDNRVGNLRSHVNEDKIFVTTYTHEPLVGVISKTDPQGRKELYEYDNSGRLRIIRNNEGNVTRQIEYHTAGDFSREHLDNFFYNHSDSAIASIPVICESNLPRLNVILQTYLPPSTIQTPNIDIEFYRKGILDERTAFPSVSIGQMYTNQISIPADTFEIRFMPSSFYTGPEIKYYYTVPADPDTFIRIYSGSIISFQVPVSGNYIFYADNTGTINGE